MLLPERVRAPVPFFVRPPRPLMAPLIVVLFDPRTVSVTPLPIDILPPMARLPVFALIQGVWFESLVSL